MKTTLELYGIDPTTLRNMKYEEALKAKVKGAKKLLEQEIRSTEKMLKSGKESREDLMQCFYRQKIFIKAVDFNEKLIDELDN